MVRDTSHLLNIIDELNLETIPDNTVLVSFDIVTMYLSIDNDRSIAAARICLKYSSSRFGS